MFSGSSDIAFQSTQSPQQVFAQIEECLESLGRVSMDESGSFEIGGAKFDGFGYKSTIDGSVRSKEGRYMVNVDWSVKPEILGWLIVICFFPIGLLVLLLPYNAKSEIERKVERALSSLKFEATGR